MGQGGVMRIMIDCSHLDLRAQTAGFSRVVSNYLSHAQQWSLSSGVAVRPMRWQADAMPCFDDIKPGSSSRHWRQMAGSRRAMIWGVYACRQLCREVASYLGRVLGAAVDLVAATMPRRRWRQACLSVRVPLVDALGGPFRLLDRLYARLPGVAVGLTADDVVFCPAHWYRHNAAVMARLQAHRGGVVMLVHDVLPITAPRYYAPETTRIQMKAIGQMLDMGLGVLAISEATRQDLLRLAWQRRVTAHIGVAHNGYEPLCGPGGPDQSPSARLAPALHHAGGYVLMVGTVEPKKGHLEVIDAMEELWREGDPRALVIIGRSGWMNEFIQTRMHESPWWQRQLFWFPGLGDADVAHAYRDAQALIFASEAEGFGLPLIEAASLGCPVVARSLPVCEEVLGACALYFDAAPQSLLQALRLVADPQVRAQLRDHLRHFNWPTWADVVPRVMEGLVKYHRDRQPFDGPLVTGQPPRSG